MYVKLAALAGALALATAGSAAATVFIDASAPFPPNPDENVLLNKGTTGLTVTGETNQSGALINFLGTESLTAPANGQARVEAADGGLTFLQITADDPLLGFSALELNLNATANGSVLFTAYDQNNTAFNFNQSLGTSGSNFFNFTTADDQVIARFTLTSNVELSDVAQVRVTVAALGDGTGGPGAIPEPATWAMMILGFGAAGVMVRRRRFALA